MAIRFPITSAARSEKAEADTALDHEGHRTALRAYFARRLQQADDIEDHVQDVYCRVLAARMERQPGTSWRNILMRVASTVWIDRFRRDKVRSSGQHVSFDDAIEVPDQRAPSPEAATEGRQQLSRIQAALMELEPVCRQAFVLARFEGMAHKEIAAHLGIPVPVVGRYIERTLLHLARRMVDFHEC